MKSDEQILRISAWIVLFCFVLAGVVAFFVWGLPTAILTFAGGAMCLTIALVWTSLQRMSGPLDMTFEQALLFAAPEATEEQKRAVLRTLKDLEYELAVGKISREDYDAISAEVRLKARDLIALQDDAMKARLQKVEERLKKRQAQNAKKATKRATPQGTSSEENPVDLRSSEAKDEKALLEHVTDTNDDTAHEQPDALASYTTDNGSVITETPLSQAPRETNS